MNGYYCDASKAKTSPLHWNKLNHENEVGQKMVLSCYIKPADLLTDTSIQFPSIILSHVLFVDWTRPFSSSDIWKQAPCFSPAEPRRVFLGDEQFARAASQRSTQIDEGLQIYLLSSKTNTSIHKYI